MVEGRLEERGVRCQLCCKVGVGRLERGECRLSEERGMLGIVAIVGGFGRLGEGNAVCRKRGMLGIMQRRLYSKVAIVGAGKRGMPFVGRERIPET
jgi:hypothetical protein